MGKHLIKHDPISGCYTEFAYDASEDRYHYNRGQDVTAIIEANKLEMNADHFRRNGEDFRKVASIPNVILHQLMESGVYYDPVAFKRWLNDPDNRLFRTTNEVV